MNESQPVVLRGWPSPGKGRADPSRDRFRHNLARIMGERGITQASLARTMDVSRVAVHAWIWGTCFPETSRVIKLAQVLGVTVGALLEDTAAQEAAPQQSQEEALLIAAFRKLPVAGRTALLAEAYGMSGENGINGPAGRPSKHARGTTA